ncbi:hypothetical protein MICRO116_140051 [Micrococcus sp. 116]|nr:hypothetical protein MICRO116_140051 [Micrococcus sp. 116]
MNQIGAFLKSSLHLDNWRAWASSRFWKVGTQVATGYSTLWSGVCGVVARSLIRSAHSCEHTHPVKPDQEWVPAAWGRRGRSAWKWSGRQRETPQSPLRPTWVGSQPSGRGERRV